MNSRGPIQKWREQPALPAAPKTGWSVVFASDEEGRFPALDYMDGIGPQADPEFPVSDAHLTRIAGMIREIQQRGPNALRGSSSFEVFKGDDAAHGMCEFRIVPHKGHRILCFMRGDREFVVTHAFRKPNQRETPIADKAAAKRLLQRHVTCAARAPRPPTPTTGNQKR